MFKLCSRLHQAAASATLHNASPKYDIFASVAICRSPIIAPEMNEIQKKFVQMCNEIEDEKSYKSDFELRREKDLKLLEKKKQLEAEGKDLSELEGEMGITTMMQEEEWIKKKENAYETYGISKHAFEHNDNAQTISRYFGQKLMLVVKQKFENSDDKYSSPWILPQVKNNNETLREIAERCIGDVFTSDVKLRIYGNAPFWHITYKYPKKMREITKCDAIGAKIFMFHCLFESFERDPKINDKWITDYKWSNVKELEELLGKSHEYYKPVKHILYE